MASHYIHPIEWKLKLVEIISKFSFLFYLFIYLLKTLTLYLVWSSRFLLICNETKSILSVLCYFYSLPLPCVCVWGVGMGVCVCVLCCVMLCCVFVLFCFFVVFVFVYGLEQLSLQCIFGTIMIDIYTKFCFVAFHFILFIFWLN